MQFKISARIQAVYIATRGPGQSTNTEADVVVRESTFDIDINTVLAESVCIIRCMFENDKRDGHRRRGAH